MGDGVLAYFGYPRALEDAAERAVYAGLALIDAIARQPGPSDEPLVARVGIATGVVVVGDLIGENASQEKEVIGETPNLAARLQAIAAPNAVLLASETQRIVGQVFEYENFSGRKNSKVFELVPAWRVIAPKTA